MQLRAPGNGLRITRAAVALALLGVAIALFLRKGLLPGGEERWLASLVLGTGLVDLLIFLLGIGLELAGGVTPGRAVAAALDFARKTGAVVTSPFALAWLFLSPDEPAAAASFALLEGSVVLVNVGALALSNRAQRLEAERAFATDAMPGRSRAQRIAAALVSGLAVGGMLAAVAWVSLHGAPQREIACPLLPNGVIPAAGLMPSACPLRVLDRVVEIWVPGDRGPFRSLAELREKAERWPDYVEWTVERGGQHVKAVVPVIDPRIRHPVGHFTTALLLAGIMLATALIIAWNTAARAAVPFLAFYSLVSVWLTAALCAGTNEYLQLASSLAFALFASPLAHLALVFPREREGIANLRGLAGLYYACGALLCGLMVLGFYASAEIWILMERLAPIFALVSWVAMLLSAIAVMYAPSSRLERALARVVLTGSLVAAGLARAIAPIAGVHSAFA